MQAQTFSTFLAKTQRYFSSADHDGLPRVLNDVASACIKISSIVRLGALAGTSGSLASTNTHGETQQVLDLESNRIFLEAGQISGLIAGMASEEMEQPFIENHQQKGRYLLVFDPLDGSSNISLNLSVGSIFSILRCPDGVEVPALQDFLQPGSQQVAAGYALYGTSTMLVITTGQGVNGFTLDDALGEFVLTHPDMAIPHEEKEFAINMSNQRFWELPVQRYIAECLAGVEGVRGKDFNMRWVASMVAEVHRILVCGGIFMYPVDEKTRERGGRLRLLYEANPMAFIIEQAGGLASTGYEPMMDVQPLSLHQRVGVILGSKVEVERVVAYHHQQD